MHDVLISYLEAEKALAVGVCHRLESVGIRCWIAPRDIPYGQGWDEAVGQAIGGSRVVVVIFSAGTISTSRMLDEIAIALGAGVTIIPFCIAQGADNAVSRLHWLDMLSASLDAHIDQLIEKVRANLSEPSQPELFASPAPQPDAAPPVEAGNPDEAAPLATPTRVIRWSTAILAIFIAISISLFGVLGYRYREMLFVPATMPVDQQATQQPAPSKTTEAEKTAEAVAEPAPTPTPEPPVAQAAVEPTPKPEPPVVTSKSLAVAGNGGAVPIDIPPPTDPKYPLSQLSIKVVGLPSNGKVVMADGATPIAVGQTLTDAEFAGLTFIPAPDVFDQSAALVFTVENPDRLSSEGRVSLTIGPKPAEPSPAEAVAKGMAAFDLRNYAEAMRWFRLAADHGDADAQVHIGGLYAVGLGVQQDYAEALRWYRLAAEQDNAQAQKNIGLFYQAGWGVKQDYDEAMRWLRLAAKQGDKRAQDSIGNLYETGHGITRDYVKARHWYRLAAEQGDASAQVNIGRLYNKGLGVERDRKKALHWFHKAADQGNAKAQANIGYLYETGRGVKQDYVEAMRWFRKAADQGNPQALSNIGALYENGWGVERDLTQARTWMEKAAAAGDKYAKKWLAEH